MVDSLSDININIEWRKRMIELLLPSYSFREDYLDILYFESRMSDLDCVYNNLIRKMEMQFVVLKLQYYTYYYTL